MGRAFESARDRDVTDGIGGTSEKSARALKTKLHQIRMRRHSGRVLKQT
jgi:hypothetical protein